MTRPVSCIDEYDLILFIKRNMSGLVLLIFKWKCNLEINRILDAAYSGSDETWMALARVAMLCNRAEFTANQEHLPVLKR